MKTIFKFAAGFSLTLALAACELPANPDYNPPVVPTKITNMNLYLTNINNSGEPVVMKDSYVWINGVKFSLEDNYDVYDTENLLENNETFIYVENYNNSIPFFLYSSEMPVWDESKYGWYDSTGLKRAVARFYYATENQFNGKIILDTRKAMDTFNTEQDIPMTGGTEYYKKNVRANDNIELGRGVYRFALKGGDGKNGGRGGDGGYGNSDNGNPNPSADRSAGVTGGAGTEGKIINGSFYWRGGVINIKVGGDGTAGGGGWGGRNGGSGAIEGGGGGGGGGGGTGGNGENSSLHNFIAAGGTGGAGGKGGHGGRGKSEHWPGDGGYKAGGAGGAANTNGTSGDGKYGGIGGGKGDRGYHGNAFSYGTATSGYCEIYYMW
jgi:hypothetical protein